MTSDPIFERLEGKAVGTTIYRNLNLIDCINQGVRTGVSVIVRNEHIAAIRNDAEVAVAELEGAKVYQCEGLFAVPGLIDAHVHLATLPNRPYAEAQLKRMLYGGITAVRDMAGDMRALADLSRASLINEIAAPDLFYAALMSGPEFYQDPRARMATLGETPGMVPWAQAVDGTTNLPMAVGIARGTNATGIKLYACMCGETVRGVIAESKRQGFPVWTHLKVFPAVPMDSIGATTVSHACMLADHVLEPDIPDYWASHKARPDYLNLSLDSSETLEYVRALASAGTIVEATLFVELYMDKRRAELDHAQGLQVVNGSRLEAAGKVTQVMHAAGVQIAAGTDLPSDVNDEYPSLQSELELLVKYAGMTPVQALASATIVNARALGKQSEMGSIEPGKLANFVLVQSNPLVDISQMRNLRLTVKRGKVFERAAYQHAPAALEDGNV